MSMFSILTALSALTFSGIPSNAAYDGLKKTWKTLTKQEWETLFEDLFINTFERVVQEQRPRLEPYVRENGVIEVDRAMLRQILRQDLDQSFSQMTYSQITDERKIEVLVHIIAQKTALILGGNTLSDYDYRAIIQTLVQRVKNEVKLRILADPDVYNRVMLEEVLLNGQILTQLNHYLQEQLNLFRLEEQRQGDINKSRGVPSSNFENLEIQPLSFTTISAGQTSNSCWREVLKPEHPVLVSQDMQFRQNCSQHFRLAELVEDVDLSFDVVLLNSSQFPVILTAVGIEVVSVASQMGGYGITRAEKILQEAHYTIELPDVISQLIKLLRPGENSRKITPRDLHLEIHHKILDPIYFEPGAVFRYELLLGSYIKNMPRFAVLKLLIMTNQGTFKSHFIHVSKF